MTVFDSNNKTNHTEATAFLDASGGVTTQRFDVLKYDKFLQFTKKQWGFFWQPTEIDISKDKKDFADLSANEKHIFTSNLKRQVLLDSINSRGVNLAFLPLVSIPELEAWITVWAASEAMHSFSYTYIIKGIYANPSIEFDSMTDIQEIVDCASDVTKHYDALIEASNWFQVLGVGKHKVNGKDVEISLYDLKKKLWLAIMSVNILEGVRFFASFCCSCCFATGGGGTGGASRMEGNAKIIKLIIKDENLHLASTQVLLKILPKDDPDFIKIAKETKEDCIKMFAEAVQQEKDWAKYLFKNGSMMGLNYELLSAYLEWIANKRMTAAGLPNIYKNIENPLPWMQSWVSGAEVQVAPQEVPSSQYIIGGLKLDVDETTFSDFKL